MSPGRKRRRANPIDPDPLYIEPKVEIKEEFVEEVIQGEHERHMHDNKAAKSYIQYTAKAQKTGKTKKILMIYPDGVKESLILEQVNTLLQSAA